MLKVILCLTWLRRRIPVLLPPVENFFQQLTQQFCSRCCGCSPVFPLQPSPSCTSTTHHPCPCVYESWFQGFLCCVSCSQAGWKGRVCPVHTHTHTHTHICVYKELYIYIHIYMYVYTIAKIWKQPKCPSTDEWIKMYTYTHIYKCIYVCVCIYIYIYIYICTYIHIYTSLSIHLLMDT